VVHVYESALVAGAGVEQTADRLSSEARRDLRGEGFDPTYAALDWEVRSDTASVAGVSEEPAGLLATLDGEPTLLRLTARYPLPRLQQPELAEPARPSPSARARPATDATGRCPPTRPMVSRAPSWPDPFWSTAAPTPGWSPTAGR
jgi:hypothetical protein